MMNKIFVSIFIFFNFTICSSVFAELKNNDDKEIREITRNISIKQALGQLIIIQPDCNYLNCYENAGFNKIIKEYKIGNFILRNENYKNNDNEIKNYKNSKIDQARGFHQFIRKKLKQDDNFPPILFIDYENSKINSISNLNVMDPIESLTLAATYNKDLISRYGKYVAHQLKVISIDSILGPVVDIDGTEQGIVDYKIGNRVFGDKEKIVIGASSHYIESLEYNNIITIIKHFPGFGHVKGRGHGCENLQDIHCDNSISNMSVFKGNNNNFSVNLQPFCQLSSISSGLMTSHFYIKSFQYNNLTTFLGKDLNDLLKTDKEINFKFLGKVRGINEDHKVAITDDLSQMIIVRKYMDQNKYSFKDISLKAFESGHDMLLFGLVSIQDRDSRFNFTINDLNDILNYLTRRAKNDKSFEDKIRNSLYNVLVLKKKMIHNWNANNKLTKWNLPIEINSSQIDSFEDDLYKDGKELVGKIFEKSFVSVNKIDENIINQDDSIFFICSQNDNSCQTYFEAYKNVKIMKKKQFYLNENEFYSEIFRLASAGNHKIIYQFDKIEDDNRILEKIDKFFNENNINKKNLYVIMHATPKVLKDEIISNYNILGNFSNHKYSYDVDKNFALGKIEPYPATQIPLNLGSSGSVNISDNNIEFSDKISRSEKKCPPCDGSQSVSKSAVTPNGESSKPEDINNSDKEKYIKSIKLLWKSLGVLSFVTGIGCFSVVYRRERNWYCKSTYNTVSECHKKIAESNDQLKSKGIILINCFKYLIPIGIIGNTFLLYSSILFVFFFFYSILGIPPLSIIEKISTIVFGIIQLNS